MPVWIILVAFAALLSPTHVFSQNSVPPVDPAENAASRMFVEPSATSVSLGKAKLKVSPLTPKEGAYVGDYQLQVTPYFFKSQKGPLTLFPAAGFLSRLSEGKPVEFIGKAINSADNTVKIVKGKATPSGADKGAVTFSIATDNGEMQFQTTYRFAK